VRKYNPNGGVTISSKDFPSSAPKRRVDLTLSIYQDKLAGVRPQ